MSALKLTAGPVLKVLRAARLVIFEIIGSKYLPKKTPAMVPIPVAHKKFPPQCIK
ncbi:hypothetical protein GN157_10435 [Flavobacterium rakeshii]|uniref:Uncharacterized protein n=1 Tax=Flavobacterium rakeshii TaxID=1038845 RepID=A0A6N8HE01_9FLAO|nr:hypothetical protein [Flavobacterium rakeshii]MUV04125.1 hypothetical protein [Flavobacterium rakeshii]